MTHEQPTDEQPTDEQPTDEQPTDEQFTYYAVWDEGYENPYPRPVRLLRLLRNVAEPEDTEESWLRPGRWVRSRFLIELGFGHEEGLPKVITAEESAQWCATQFLDSDEDDDDW